MEDLEKKIEILEQENKVLKEVSSNSPGLKFVTDEAGKILHFYGDEEQLYAKPEDFINKTFSEVIPEKANKEIMKAIKEAKLKGFSRQEYPLTIKDEIKNFSVRTNYKNNQFFHTVLDITEKKELMDLLKKSEEKFRTYIHNSPTSVFSVNQNGNYIFANPSAYNLLGYTHEEMLNLSIPEIHDKNQLDAILKQFEDLKKNGKLTNFETQLKTKQGKLIDVILDAVKLSDTEYLAYVKDISEISKLKKDYEIVFNSTQDSMFLVEVLHNQIFKYITNNKSHEENTGISTNQLKDKTPQELVGKELGDIISSNYQKCVESKKSITYEEELELPKGKATWSTTLSPVLENNEVKYIVGSSQNITKEKMLFEELKKSNETKDKFFSIIAHDLKSPFNSILGFSEILKNNYDDFDDNEKIEFIKNIYKSSKNAYNLLNNLLEWAKSSSTEEKYNPKEINLREIINNNFLLYVDKLSQSEEQNKIKFNNLVYPDLTINADENMINTIFRNLINNSVKNTPVDGAIQIYATEKEDAYVISVKDTGKGMDNETIDNLFDISKNISKPDLEGNIGTGLGLNIVKNYIDKHNGEINVESELNKGTTFYITLPKYR